MHRIFITVLLLLTISLPASAKGLTVYSGTLPMLHSRDAALGAKGYSFDVLEILLKNTGHPLNRKEIQFPPWPRSIKNVETTPETLLVGVARTTTRETKFFWVGPYSSLRLGLIAKKSRALRIKDDADVKKLSIAVVQDSAPLHILRNKYGIASDNLELVTSDVNQYRMLQADRVDAITHTTINAPQGMREVGLNPDDYEMIHVLRVIDLYFVLNPADASPLGEGMQQEMLKLAARDDGMFLENLLRSHLADNPINMAR